ncbi:hypothetical protein BDW71DRAFT_177395 [Aspergillus fruticulosus]
MISVIVWMDFSQSSACQKILTRIIHLSFRDYLLLTESPFRINETETHEKIAIHRLRVMDYKLSHNICGLASYGLSALGSAIRSSSSTSPQN